MRNGQISPEDASWWDLHELKFWLWAFSRNADVYLQTSFELEMAGRRQLRVRRISQWNDVKSDVDKLKHEAALASYHLASSTGVLVHLLERSQRLFPSIRPACRRARHLFKEGRMISDMIECAYGRRGHSDEDTRHHAQFGREDIDSAANAMSTVVRGGEHWLANRFCVEKAADEVRAIQKAADEVNSRNSRSRNGSGARALS